MPAGDIERTLGFYSHRNFLKLKEIMVEARAIFCSDTESSSDFMPLLLAGLAENHALNKPEHDPNHQPLHQEGHDHLVDEAYQDLWVEKKPHCHQGGNETKDTLRPIEEISPGHK